MKSNLSGHLVNQNEWKSWTEYENYIFDDEKLTIAYNAYQDTPSKDECDKLCAALSGKVITYFV